MNYKEYEKAAITTKCYADEVKIPYVVLGLCGEFGEFCEKLKSFNKDDDASLIIKELGDICWYLASIRVEMNLPVPEDWTWREVDLNSDCFDLAMRIGAIAEQIKKYLRDDYKVTEDIAIPETRIEKIIKNWYEIWDHLTFVATQFYTSIEEICRDNINKLASRAARNVIHGEGDMR